VNLNSAGLSAGYNRFIISWKSILFKPIIAIRRHFAKRSRIKIRDLKGGNPLMLLCTLYLFTIE
jgi:hypothetical protein